MVSIKTDSCSISSHIGELLVGQKFIAAAYLAMEIVVQLSPYMDELLALQSRMSIYIGALSDCSGGLALVT